MKFQNLRNNIRFDHMTRRAARYPFEHATPADYAKSVEGPIPGDVSIMRHDLLYWIMLTICVSSIVGAVGIAIVEIWLRRVA
jgi:hypothetical protein